jgi:hypothetical protein
MTAVKTPEEKGKGTAADPRVEREKRLAEALRANLRRRKAGGPGGGESSAAAKPDDRDD